jgi:hypothetical protein
MAIFEDRGSADLELVSPPDENVHVLSVELSPSDFELEVDGRIVHAGIAPVGGSNIVAAGSRPVARVRGAFSVLQVYLPAAGLRSLALDLGVPQQEVAGLTLIDPAFAIDRRLMALATNLDRRLRLREEMPRLELDHISLALSEHLVRRWSSANILPTEPRGLVAMEQDAILEYLLDSDDPDYHGLSILLDRTAIEAHRDITAAMRRTPLEILRSRGRRCD